jgi:two-component sensor histidine kinase/CHASE1-domain containing sensor protein
VDETGDPTDQRPEGLLGPIPLRWLIVQAVIIALIVGAGFGAREYASSVAFQQSEALATADRRVAALRDMLSERAMMARAIGSSIGVTAADPDRILAGINPQLLTYAGNVYTLVWVREVEPANLSAAEARLARINGRNMPVFGAGWRALTPEERARRAWIISAVLPMTEQNALSIGLNAATRPGPAEALARARRTGDVAVTGPIELVQLPGEPAIVAYMPVVRDGELLGFIGTSYLMKDLAVPMRGRDPIALPYRMFDAAVPDTVLAQAGTMGELLMRRNVSFGGRSWIAEFGWPPGARRQALMQALMVGAVAAAIAGLLLAALIRYRMQNERLRAAIAAREAAEARLNVVIGELRHRVRNCYAVAQAVGTQSMRGIPGAAGAAESFAARMVAMAGAADLLTQQDRSTIEGVIRASHLPFAGRVRSKGPPAALGPSATQSFALLIHELWTNALKHGALSQPDGEVKVDWRIERERLIFEWREQAGWPMAAELPARRGFGRQLLERLVPQQLGGRAGLAMTAEGLIYTLDADLRRMAEEGSPAAR